MSIILDKVNYVYSEGTAYQIQALKDVNLTIEDGQFIGVIGHTGSGKSTLIQHLNGLMKATSGTIYFHGQDIYEDDFDLRELRNRVGLVFQYPEHQLFETTIFDDVCFGPKNQGLSKEEAGLRAFEALRSVGLPEELYYQSPFDLSGGQKRRVAIAGVLAMKPEVLILVEPTAGLDPAGRDEILRSCGADAQGTRYYGYFSIAQHGGRRKICGAYYRDESRQCDVRRCAKRSIPPLQRT